MEFMILTVLLIIAGSLFVPVIEFHHGKNSSKRNEIRWSLQSERELGELLGRTHKWFARPPNTHYLLQITQCQQVNIHSYWT